MSTKDFQILNKLGEGSFSSVWKVKRISDGQEYAMKKVKLAALSEKEKQNALNEVRILASIKNPFIIGYKEAFFEDNSMTLCVVMEYAGGGDIFNKIVKHQKGNTYFKEKEIWNFATQMLIGLKVLHDMKILHRDLKCANIFLSTDGKIAKLGDLNVSKVTGDNLAYTQTGTPYYASPEVWSDKPYDMKSDLWSLGCVIYEMCALKPPFRANDMQGLFKKIQKGIFDKIPSQYSIDMTNFISMCLQVKPSQRPSCDQLLSHPVVQRNGREVLETLEEFEEAENQLLGTIKLQKNIRSLANLLPKANYEEEFQPSERERGRIGSADPRKYAKREEEVKRPISQSAQKNGIISRDAQSRDSRITQMQKQEVSERKETEKEYLARMQKEYIEKAKIIQPTDLKNQKSPKVVESKLPPRSPEYRPISGKKNNEAPNQARQGLVQNQVYGDNRPKVVARNDVYGSPQVQQRLNSRERSQEGLRKNDIYSPPQVQQRLNSKERAQDGLPRQDVYSSPQVQQRLNSRERGQEGVGFAQQLADRQEYLINKYQARDNKPGDLRPSSKNSNQSNDILLRKADDLLQRYQGIDINKREGIASRENAQRPASGIKKAPLDMLDRYQNIYNAKEGNQRILSAQVGGNRPDYQYLNQNNLVKKDYAVNNANIIKQQAQARGVVKPNWWG